MRGKAIRPQLSRFSQRITPAYAGKSLYSYLYTLYLQDHPRLCGEKQCRVQTAGIKSRITPAYAGKRELLHLRSGGDRDHPRLCGEKTKKIPKQRYFFHQPASFSFSLQYT